MPIIAESVGPLSLSILDQAPRWLRDTCVSSLWLVRRYDGLNTGSLALSIATCWGCWLHRACSFVPFPPASRIDDQSLPRGECCSFFHLKGGELRPSSNYQLSTGYLSCCCSCSVSTAWEQTNHSSAASTRAFMHWKKIAHAMELLTSA